MPRFAPNFHHLFVELPVEERFAAAAACGFDAIEWHMPYVLSKARLKSLLNDNGLKFLYATVPWDAKVGGLGGQPGRETEFRQTADQAIDYALDVGFHFLQIGHGAIPDDVTREQCLDVYVKNIAYVCDQVKSSDVRIVIEPVATAVRNRVFVMSKMSHAAEVLRRVNNAKLGLVFDTYHLRMEEEGPLTAILSQYSASIDYVQIGNAPTRNEPGVGEIDLDFIVNAIDDSCYKGWIGMEFNPSKDTWTSLKWLERYGYRMPPSPVHARRLT
jgi:hydroxypyruvate isomerase